MNDFEFPAYDGPVSIGPMHRGMTPDALMEEVEKHLRSESHLWVALTLHTISDNALRQRETSSLILDRENLISVSMGCVVCEQGFESRLFQKRCPGEPENA